MAQTTFDDIHSRSAITQDGTASLLDRSVDLARARWETVAWLALLALALLARVLWLHAWPLSQEEGATATALWSLLTEGTVASAPPAGIGPVVAFFSAFWLFVFGAFDDSLRLGSALVGFATVAACWWLRPYLGRAGALAAAALLTWSPLALYGSRHLTPEPYAVFFLLVLVIALLRLYNGGGVGALATAVAAFTLATFSHYLALPLGLLLALAAPLAARLVAAADDGSTPTPPTELDGRAATLTRPTLGGRSWAVSAITVAAVVVVLALLATGGGPALLLTLLSPLAAWNAVAPPPERAGAFVPLLLLVYEPLIVVAGLAGAWLVAMRHDQPLRRVTTIMLVVWAVAGLLFGALLGDRSPAQSLYAIVPLALLGGHLIAAILAAIPWTLYYRRFRGPALTVASALALIALVLLVNSLTSPTSIDATVRIVKLLLDVVVTVVLIAATVYLARPFGMGAAGRVISLTVLGVLALYSLRSATQLTYVNPANAVEMAVQEQTSPGLLAIVARIDRLSRDVTGLRRTTADPAGGHGLMLAIDRSLAAPLDWYFREYPNRVYFSPAEQPTNGADVVIISAQAATAAQSLLNQNYVGQSYPFAWSFPNRGIGGGPAAIVRYLLYREPPSAPVPTEFSVYLRRDLADRVLFRGAPAATAPAAPTGVAFNAFDRNGRGRAAGQFEAPRGVAVDGEGNVYVVDTANTRLQKFTADGVFQWSVGGPGSGPGQFARIQNGPGPTGIAVDNDGHVYVADTWNHRVVKLDSQGRFVTAWGGFVNTQGDQEVGQRHPREFYGPRGVAIGPDNNVYVTDTGNKRVLVFDRDGQPLRQWGGAGTGPGNLDEPVGIAVDEAGVVYVADTNNGRIAVFNAEGQPVAQWPVMGWGPNIYQEPYIAIGDDGVYVTSGPTRSVMRFDRQGNLLDQRQEIDGETLMNPTGIALTADGQLIVVDTGAHAVLRSR